MTTYQALRLAQQALSCTMILTSSDDRKKIDKALAAIAEALQAPTEPPPGLLMSMAIRFDHGLGCPGYYYSELFRGPNEPTHAQRLESTLRQMRQLWEEVVGLGFYRPEKEAEYGAMRAASQPGEQEAGKL